jgi:hypothetical protein
MMGYGSRVRADESTYLGNYIIAASYGDDESLVDILPIRFGEGPATRSLRVGLAMSIYPHYPDSRQFETAIAPFKYVAYHGEITLATWGNSILRFEIPARANFEVTTRHVLSQALYGPVRPTKLNFTPPRPKI